jgi:hypothetical protein
MTGLLMYDEISTVERNLEFHHLRLKQLLMFILIADFPYVKVCH